MAAVLDDMGKEAPQDFKQLWPAIGTMLEAIRGVVRTKRVAVAMKERERASAEYRERAIREMEQDKSNPQEWNRMLDEAAEKISLGRRVAR